MPFQKGHPKYAGREPGTPNKRTAAVRDVIQLAAYQLGGWERLVAWVKEDPQHEEMFWCSMFARLLPTQVTGSGALGEIELNAKLTPEELAHQLMERGLPVSLLYGVDVPEPDLSNGSDAPLLDQFGDDVPPVGSNGQYFRG